MHDKSPTIQDIETRIEDVRVIQRISSVATCSIVLRLNRFMGGLEPRVSLLLRTLSLCFMQMAIYYGFIMVVFLGFLSFSLTHFSPWSSAFVEAPQVFISNFELPMGKMDVMKSVHDAFAIISLQMLSAIMNYSYNMACEELNPEFERQAQEKKREAQTRSMKPPWYAIITERKCGQFKCSVDCWMAGCRSGDLNVD